MSKTSEILSPSVDVQASRPRTEVSLTRVGVRGVQKVITVNGRARQAAMETLRRGRQQVLSFLLRHGRIYSGGGHWTRKHRLWLAAQHFDHPARQIAFEELVAGCRGSASAP